MKAMKLVGIGVSFAVAMSALAGMPAVAEQKAAPRSVASTPGATVPFVQVDVGTRFAVALGADGNTYAWGNNDWGQLGNGTTTPSTTPVKVKTPAGVSFTQVAAGDYSVLAIGSDGSAYAWGDNRSGQLGNGSTRTSLTPTRVKAMPGVVYNQVAANSLVSAAAGSDGNVYAWGDDRQGLVGDGSTSSVGTPSVVHSPPGVSFLQVTAGRNFLAALGTDGNAYTWGDNTYGQLGNGGTAAAKAPVKVPVPRGVTFSHVEAGELSVTAIGYGAAYAWGYNLNGELGDGTTTTSRVPVKVKTPAGVSFTQVEAGYDFVVAIGSDRNTYVWGDNRYGQLGNGTLTRSSAPVKVPAPTGVAFTNVAAGYDSLTAIGSDGNSHSWGNNDFGQLGNGGTSNSAVPVKVSPVQ